MIVDNSLPDYSTEQALAWAFEAQRAQLDFLARDTDFAPPSFGTEYLLIQREKLGATVQTSRKFGDKVHLDAETLAGIVSKLPAKLGGSRYAIRFVQYIRAGCRPTISSDATPKLTPRKILPANGKAPERAATKIVESYREVYHVPHPKNPQKTIKRSRLFRGEWVPCYWKPEPEQIARERAGYTNYRNVVLYVFEQIRPLDFTRFNLTGELPPEEPEVDSSGLDF